MGSIVSSGSQKGTPNYFFPLRNALSMINNCLKFAKPADLITDSLAGRLPAPDLAGCYGVDTSGRRLLALPSVGTRGLPWDQPEEKNDLFASLKGSFLLPFLLQQQAVDATGQ